MLPTPVLPLLLHIPHAGTHVPSLARRAFKDQGELIAEQNRLTDWFTDELFACPGAVTCATPVSRLVVDTERFADDALEPMAKLGQGVIYSHSSEGTRLRDDPDGEERRQLLENYYRPWHLKLTMDLQSLLQSFGRALLIDAHSFPEQPLAYDNDQGRSRPDICLGVCSNTPDWLVESAQAWCEKWGLSVAIDYPYSGCLVPSRFAGDRRVAAIMIEVNRRLYLDQPEPAQVPVRSAGFARTRGAISELLLMLCSQLTNRLKGEVA